MDVENEWVPLKPSPSDYQDNEECHDRGAVLVATIFDAFHRIYTFRTRDLLRIASGGTGSLPEGSISRDLVHRLAGEAAEIALHFLHICIRALDYCPPIDISFGDYLRALITADLDIAPEDESGYRLALIEAFRARGIFPSRVTTLSVESLCWERPNFTRKEQGAIDWIASQLKESIRDLVDTKDRRELYDRSRAAQAKLHGLLMGKEQRFLQDSEWENFLGKLGLTSLPLSALFGAKTRDVRFVKKTGLNQPPPIEVHTVRPAFRSGREGRQIEQVIVTFTQSVTVDIGEDRSNPQPMSFRGGCSMILSFGSLNTVDYVIRKDIRSYRRFLSQVEYLNGDGEDALPTSSSLYADSRREPRLDFGRLHSHA